MDPSMLIGDKACCFDEIWTFPATGNGRFRFDLYTQDPSSGLESAGKHGGKKRRSVNEDYAEIDCSVNIVAGSSDSDGKQIKVSGTGDEDGGRSEETGTSSGKEMEQNTQQTEAHKQEYIHVRARRGQATDSHSLAERARREKISERMKILQEIVPGCNKVIGKALVLDEIINYIQSLQRQVEFLSMKLEAVNSQLNCGFEIFPHKDLGQESFDATGMALGSQITRGCDRNSSPEWLHMQIGGGFERTH